MPQVNITIKNIAEIRRAFGQAPRLMARELDDAIKKSVFSISRDSMINTPVDTGRLRASTYQRFASLRGEVGTNTNYDVFVHEGTRFMPARPYLAQAVESNDSKVQRYFKDAVQKVLDKIGRET